MNKKVTIQDIADALCISRNTVSKAINNADGLADSTREKILQKAGGKFPYSRSSRCRMMPSAVSYTRLKSTWGL